MNGADPVRTRAATDLEHNLVVLAGAGTGKTSLLVERLLVTIGRGHASIDEIVAITFTEKAAGELKDRLALGLERLQALTSAATTPDPAQEADRVLPHLLARGGAPPDVADRALGALRRIDVARVTTIHAFCGDLLRAFPREAGLSPDFEIDAGARTAAVLEEGWDRFVRECFGGAPPAAWERLLAGSDLSEVREAALRLASFGVPDEARLGRRAEDLLAVIAGESAVHLRAIELARARVRRGSVHEHDLVAEGLRTLIDGGPAALRTWLEDGSRAATLHALSRSAKETRRPAAGWLLDVAEADEGLHEELLSAVEPFLHRARESLLARGIVSYDGLLLLAHRLLATHPDVRDELARRWRMILVDEMQDTDPLQAEIVLFLSGAPGDRARDAFAIVPQPGRLFLVGDLKQSIYRFRGADAASVRRWTAHVLGHGGVRLSLDTSFRSGDEVLEPIHELFGDGSRVWTPSDYQPEYRPVRAARPPAGGAPAVEVWTVGSGHRILAEQRRDAEALVLAREIRAAADRGEHDYRSATVLLQAFPQSLRPLLRALRSHGVPFLVRGGREFFDRPEVAHALALLRAVAEPADEVALVAFLRSPAGGVPDTELALWASASGGAWDRSATPDRGRYPELARALSELREMVALARDLPGGAAVRRLVERSRLLALEATAFEGAQRVANLRKLVEAAAEVGRDGGLSLLEIVQEIEGARGTELESESPLADEHTDAVRVMTIHSAKGLENDVVYVLDLARQQTDPPPRRRTTEVAPFATAAGSWALALRVGARRNLGSLARQVETRRHEEAEKVRVLYVALTRARRRLVVVCGPAHTERTWMRALEAWGYRHREPPADGALLAGGRVVHRVLEPSATAAAAPRPVDVPELAAVIRERSTRRAMLERARPAGRSPSSLVETPLAGPPRGVRAEGRSLALAVGAVVHAQLERWDLADAASLLRGLDAASAAAAREQRVPADRVRAGARDLLAGVAGSPLAARLREVELVGREIPLLLREGDGTWQGSIDLLYRDASGAWAIGDYKTDESANEESLRTRYRPQLDVYARAVQSRMYMAVPPRAELWLVRTGRIVTV